MYLHAGNQDSSCNSYRTGQTEVLLQFPFECSSTALFQATLTNSLKSRVHFREAREVWYNPYPVSKSNAPKPMVQSQLSQLWVDHLLQFTVQVPRICSLPRGPAVLPTHPSCFRAQNFTPNFMCPRRLLAPGDDPSFAEGRAADDVHLLADEVHLLAGASHLLEEEVTGTAPLPFQTFPQ